MGIRFACHVCDKHLNIKQELAGRRGVCPACSSRFRIPLQDAEKSTPVESKQQQVGPQAAHQSTRHQPATQRSTTFDVDTASHPSPTAHQSAIGSVEQPTDDPGISTPGIATPGDVFVGQNKAEGIPTDPVSGSSISMLDDEPDATWYVRPPSGGQYGPATGTVLRQWISEGRVAATALLWRDGWPQWRDACEALPELAIHLPQGSAVAEQTTTSASDSTAKSPSPIQSPELTGQSEIGAQRRNRSFRRVSLIGLLSVVALALVGVLVIVIKNG